MFHILLQGSKLYVNEIVNKKIAKNMNSNFGYIQIDPQYCFFLCVLDYYLFARLLEIKNIYIEGVIKV